MLLSSRFVAHCTRILSPGICQVKLREPGSRTDYFGKTKENSPEGVFTCIRL